MLIKIDGLIQSASGEITEDSCVEFGDEFLALVEKHGWGFGGAIALTDDEGNPLEEE